MSMLQVGYGEKKITPPLRTDLAGFGFYLDRRATTIRDDLKARVLYLKNKETTLIIISLDLLSLSVEFSDKIRTVVAEKHGLPLKNVLLSCTHTHSGPAVQPLPGLGKANPYYVRRLPQIILDTTINARVSIEEATFGHHIEAVEPIGYNRRLNDFSEIDPWLRVGIFRLKKKAVFIMNYACHPVTLGPTKEISADWPGAAVRAIEKARDKGMVLQGFCGDIDPVTYMNRRLGATKQDYELCGQIIASRAQKSGKYAIFMRQVRLNAAEERIRLPLSVFPREDLDKETAAAMEANKQFPHAPRVIRAWREKVVKVHDAFLKSPWMDNVPIQAMSIGEMKIIGLPGEAFCGLALRLREKWPSLMTVGYANGDIGYLPTRDAFKRPDDYACYCAPKFYGNFNFSPEVESVLLEASNKILSTL